MVAVAALALGAYAAFFGTTEPAQASGSNISVSSTDVDNRLAALDKRIAAHDQRLTALDQRLTGHDKRLAAHDERLTANDERLVALDQRLVALEKQPATPATPASGAPAAGAAPGASIPPAAATAGSSPPVSRDNKGDGPFDIVPNAELKGRLGRIVVTFPTGTKASNARADIYKSGEAKGLRTEFGDFGVEMTPGTYDLNISGHLVPGVVVESRSDTRVHVGVLRLNASGQTRFDLYEPGSEKSFGTYFGQNEVGLPPGRYDIAVSGQRETVTITAGAFTEF